MEFNKYIVDMRLGDEFEGYYILVDPENRVGSNGKPFMSGRLADRSGSLPMKVWNFEWPSSPIEGGIIVMVRGRVTEFKSTLQLTLSSIREPREEEDINLEGLVPTAPIDRADAEAEVRELLSSIADPDYRAAAEALLEAHRDAFVLIPAGKSMHHGFIGGLLMHTLNMLRAADFMADLYAEVIDRSLLLAGTFAHDLMKEREFELTALGLVREYSTAGQLLGHLVMGAQEAARICASLGVPEEKSLLLQHMILSHHGSPEFGAPVPPMIPEAELLSKLDGIDSRMEIYAEHLPEAPEGGFTQFVTALGRRIYRQRDSETGQ